VPALISYVADDTPLDVQPVRIANAFTVVAVVTINEPP
jgi:hypothetical protein